MDSLQNFVLLSDDKCLLSLLIFIRIKVRTKMFCLYDVWIAFCVGYTMLMGILR